MTRFARARGSKSSNERKEEEATPWTVMKNQLRALNNDDYAEKNPDKSAYKLERIIKDSHAEKGENWSKFEELEEYCNLEEFKTSKNKTKSKETQCNNTKLNHSNALKDTDMIHKKNSKDLKMKSTIVKGHNERTIQNIEKLEVKDKKCKKNIQKPKFCSSSTDINNSKKKCNKNCESLDITDNLEGVKDTKNGPFHKKQSFNKSFTQNNTKKAQTIIANGRKIFVVNYEGFMIRKCDALMLKKLRKKLKSQNIPNDKIKTVMKLERRKAEKALAREKNNVCFHCRKFGHNFSDCPDIKDTNMSKSGMCFKCGSMEHSHSQCKISKSQDFGYAVCFVCREQGHIARQCPVNPQGQYPKGGCCHLCMEVTHLRKDCPKAFDGTLNTSLTVEQIKMSEVEDLSEVTTKSSTKSVKKTKVIPF